MTTRPTIGSLFSGYGGLDLAVEQVLDAETVWTCDVDPAASRILRHRFPHAPNLGDISAVNWPTVRPVKIVTGGFPCQDVSHAGAGAGLGPGTRTGLWARMADGIDHLRPRLVVAENVRGLLSAAADSDVEPCPWCLGGAGDGEPSLRALGSVLADLADLGYDAAWHGLRAADVGAPHGRFRVFVLAWPAVRDADPIGRERRHVGQSGAPAALRGSAAADADDFVYGVLGGGVPGAQACGERRGSGADRGSTDRRRGAAPDSDGVGSVRAGGSRRGRGGSADDGRRSVPDAACDGWDERRPESAGHVGRPDAAERGAAAADADSGISVGKMPRGEIRQRGSVASDDVRLHVVEWGDYGLAVRRWESVLGRLAPAPTEVSRGGGQRLSPRFVEWLMGLPDGWVTDVPGLSRNDQLKALGNGVVPQQAAAALRVLLTWASLEEAS